MFTIVIAPINVVPYEIIAAISLLINVMPFHKIFFVILLTFFSNALCAATFIVTNNADSGPGTLRDALTQAAANGSNEKDYINFNIPDLSTAGRTIILISPLPDLSSNLVIDGSTQTGMPFGKSNAHVEIATPHNYIAFTSFNGTGLNDVEFYGLYIYDYSDTQTSYPDLQIRLGITITKSTNIIIGGAGKGNLIKGYNKHMIYLSNVTNITIKGNVLGLADNNDLIDSNGLVNYSADVNLLDCNNINVGGTTDEGNIFFCVMNIDLPAKITNGLLTIKSNNFGVFQDGKTTTFYYQDINFVQIYSAGLFYFATPQELAKIATANIDIENNAAGNFSHVFSINALKGSVNIVNNFLGIARDGVSSLNTANSSPNIGTPLYINCPAQVNIGGTDLSAKNFFAHSTGAVIGSTTNIFIRNNEYECVSFAYNNDTKADSLPKIQINELGTNNSRFVISGLSDPGATIDIYASESCTYVQCGIRKYIETVLADNNGNWKSSGLNTDGIFYVSATLNNRTSLFRTFEINYANAVITNLRCNNEASVTGLQVPKGLSYNWTDGSGKIVSTDLDLQTTKSGLYQFHLGGDCIVSKIFQINDYRVVIDDTRFKKNDPGCGNNSGSMKGLFIYDPENKIKEIGWFDISNTEIGKSADIKNLAAGTYTLKVFTTDGCEKDYGPITLKNTTGPNIDQSQQQMQSTNCGQSTGTIKNIIASGTGTLKYIWWNDKQQNVSTDKDLVGQPAGTYRLQVTDDSQCGPVYSTDISIPETNGITMDETNATPANASCGNANGSVTGIHVTGAIQYSWTDANGKVVGTAADLQNMLPGTYTLTASNGFGCSKTSKAYPVVESTSTTYPEYPYISENTCAGSNTGSVKITADNLVKSFRWVNSQGQNAGANNQIDNLSAGTYHLYLTDNAGCESFYASYNITSIAPLIIVPGSEQITSDECQTSAGSIKNIQLSGGIGPYTYAWTDASGKNVSTSAELTKVGAGVYTLIASDASGCRSVTNTYTVQNTDNTLSPPVAGNIQLCSARDATLQVSSPSAGYTYRLYDSPTSAAPLDEQASGSFKITAITSRSYYLTQAIGDCESARAEINVSVGLSVSNIANTFTPNGDGINDYWQITGIENYTAATVQVFNRYGQKVFESKGYAKPFDGTMNGQKLPVGVYYYIINLSTSCNLLSGSLTLLR